MEKARGQLDCIQCGYCCGYRRETPFGGAEWEDGTKTPVDEDDVCIHLEKLDNGFTRCAIHYEKPKQCNLYYCLIECKIRQLQVIIDELKIKAEQKWPPQH